ncbi:MAG: hypothetical protein GQ467_05175 [Mariprofundaceae bacterium]|nr:hypothetical protein [Mariprofundaceae bacterium]
MNRDILSPVRHGLIMAVAALIFGALWAGFLATQHEILHTGFESQQLVVEQSEQVLHNHDHNDSMHTTEQHSHSGNLANDAMQRLLRGHIHFMGLGVLVTALLLITTFTSLNDCWKKALGWSFGIGAVAYPPAWILMGLRTVTLGPEAAEASVMWLFMPAVGLLLLSMSILLAVLMIEWLGWQNKSWLSILFKDCPNVG